MTLIKMISLCFIGLSVGFIISAGLFAFITVIGVLARLAIRTKTANKVMLYEDVVVLGATAGNLLFMFNISIPIGWVGLLFFGLFSGCFIGCLAVAIEEVIQVFPMVAYRLKLQVGMPIIVLALAIGKAVGTIYQLVLKG